MRVCSHCKKVLLGLGAIKVSKTQQGLSLICKAHKLGPQNCLGERLDQTEIPILPLETSPEGRVTKPTWPGGVSRGLGQKLLPCWSQGSPRATPQAAGILPCLK